MEFRVEDHVQVDQSHSFAVRERPSKSGKLPHASSWTVEFRSALFKMAGKIWVGTFKTRGKANKACDAALHFLGLPTHYYTYPPSGHFRQIGELPQDEVALKKRVKSWAMEYAKRPLPIIAATPTVVASEDSAPQLDHLALQNFQADPTVRNVCEVGRATYPISSPRVPASSSSSSPCRESLGMITKFLEAEDLEPEDQSLEDSNEFKHIYSELQACFEIPAREVGAGSADAAMTSANKEAANDFIGSIDSPLASVPRLEAHTRRHRPEFARIEGTDNLDQLEHADMCKSTED